MRSPTAALRKLRKSLKAARVIVRGVDPSSCVTPLQDLKVQAFVLLCHSAFEEYLEELGLSVGLEARRRYGQGYVTLPLVCLVSAKLLDDASLASAKKKIDAGVVDLDAFSAAAFNLYRFRVSNNMGIKKENQQMILVPIGVDPESIDVVGMNALDGFGAKRGQLAHSFKPRRQVTLNGIESDLKTIMAGLEAFDKAACVSLSKRMR